MTSRPTLDDLRRIATWGDPAEAPAPADLATRRPGAQPQPAGADDRRTFLRVAAGVLAVVAVAAAVVLATDPADPIPAAQGTWRSMATGPLEPRTDPAAVWTGTEMLVFGGFGAGGRSFLDGAAYEPGADRWRPMARYPYPASGLWASGLATWTGTELLVFLRPSDVQRWDWDLVAYDPATDRWRRLLEGRFDQRADDTLVPRSPVPVDSPEATAWIAGELVVVGWVSQLESYAWTSLDIATGTWSEPRDLPDSIDFYMQPKRWAGTDRHLLFLREGPIHDGRRWSAYLIDPLAGDARRVEAPRPLPGSVAMEGWLTAAGGRFVLAGVWTNDESRSTWATHVLDPEAGRRPGWEAAAAPVPSSAWAVDQPGGALVGTAGGTFLLGGLASSRPLEGGDAADGTARVSDPAVARWADLPRPPIDIRRGGHAAVWTGREVLVWGGIAGLSAPATGDLLSDGAVYELPLDGA